VIGKDIDTLQRIADRERSDVSSGDVTGDHRFTFESKRPVRQWILLGRFLWKFTKVVMHDSTIDRNIQI
jgi:phosphoribosylformylglycinamidine synthase